jgi:hypothetical protein
MPVHAGGKYNDMILLLQFPDICFVIAVFSQTVKKGFVLAVLQIVGINKTIHVCYKSRENIIAVMPVSDIDIKPGMLFIVTTYISGQ